MPQSRLKDLKNPSELKEAFALFSKQSSLLEEAYRSLKQAFDVKAAMLHKLVTQIDEALILIRFDGRFNLFNPAAEKVFQLDAKDVLQKSYFDFFSDTFFGFSMREALATQRGKKVVCLAVSNGQKLEVTPSFLQEGVVLLVRDHTQLEHLKIAAERSDRLKELGEMAASLAHEIRNPLGGIEGFASLLCDDLQQSPKQLQMAAMILEGTKRLNRLVSSICAHAKPYQVKLKEVDLVPLIKKTLALFTVDPKVDVKVAFKTEVKSLPLFLDVDLFTQALFNLLLNANDASEMGQKVWVRLKNEEKNAILTVQDYGTGMDAAMQKKAFTPFFTTKEGGSGLGLSEVNKAIDVIGGRLYLTSTPNLGTKVSILLPRNS